MTLFLYILAGLLALVGAGLLLILIATHADRNPPPGPGCSRLTL